jgi:hypothetical protein
MDKESVVLLQTAGFHQDTEMSNYFWRELEPDDRDMAIRHVLPNHFTPSYNFRGVFIAHMYENDKEREFWYATSNIRGTYRGYRCHNEYGDFDTANIFTSGKTCLDTVTMWLENYIKRRYNQR